MYHHKTNVRAQSIKFKSCEIPSEFIFLPEQFHDRSRNNHPGTIRSALYRSCPGNWNSPENKAGRDGQIIMWKSFMRKKASFWYSLIAMLAPPNKNGYCMFFHFHLISYSRFILPIWKNFFNQNVIDISLLVVSNLRNIAFKLYAVQTAILDISSSNWFSVAL